MNHDNASKEEIDNLAAANAFLKEAAAAGNTFAIGYLATCDSTNCDPFALDDDAFDDADIRPY